MKNIITYFSSFISHLSSPMGFSLIEVVLAAALFITFATAATVAVISGYNSNRLGAEFTIGNQFAAEGMEATKSIKNQLYTSLVNSASTGVIRNGSNVWAFSPPNNTFSSGKTYTRILAIASANRSTTPPEGNIVASGGTTDPDTKKVTSRVTWNFNSARPESISLISYLSDWKKPIEGMLLYGETTSVARPRYRVYSNLTNNFGTEQSTGNGFTDTLVGKTFSVQSNPTKSEVIAGYVSNSGALRIVCFDGTTWTSEWTFTVGGTGTNAQRFGIAFEKTTGDAMVVYGTNTATTNELAYRTKPGSTGCGSANWSGATNLNPTRTSGIVHWIRMESSPVSASNNIALAWADANSDLSAMIWTGASWAIAEPAAALETELERITVSQDVLSFDLAYESISGNLMIVWGPNGTTCIAVATETTTLGATNCIRYNRYTTGWQTTTVMRTVADRASNIDIAANPNSNEIVMAAVDNNQTDLSQAYWSGSAPWSGKADQDTTCQPVTAGSKRVATGWLTSGATTRSITVYNDLATNNVGWVVGTTGTTFTTQTAFTPAPVFAIPQQWYVIERDPKNSDRLMFTLSDNGSDLHAKRLVMTSTPTPTFTWTNSNGTLALETTLGQLTTKPFGFTYLKNP